MEKMLVDTTGRTTRGSHRPAWKVAGGYALLLTLVLLFVLMTPVTVLADGFKIAPSAIDITVPSGGSAIAYVYVTSDFSGELVVGTEGIPFRVEPGLVQIAPGDDNRVVELTFYGDSSVTEGSYSGKVTFLSYAGDNVACGVKVRVNVNHVGQGGGGQISSLVDGLIEGIEDNYVPILMGALAVVALVVGIMIGRRRGHA